jgi:hypothetical protein
LFVFVNILVCVLVFVLLRSIISVRGSSTTDRIRPRLLMRLPPRRHLRILPCNVPRLLMLLFFRFRLILSIFFLVTSAIHPSSLMSRPLLFLMPGTGQCGLSLLVVLFLFFFFSLVLSTGFRSHQAD